MRKQELHPRTNSINNKQKHQSKTARIIALRWLMQKFPHAFDNSELIRPLKLGIMEDVLAHAPEALEAGISKSKLREAVVLFTRRIDYLASLKAQEMRVDLDGKPVAPVTAEEAENASNKIKRRIEKIAKNARKSAPKTEVAPAKKTYGSYDDQQPSFPIYPQRAPAYNSQSESLLPAKSTPVIIKHKSSKQFDPNAVARLKEKLGLSVKSEAVE